VNGTSVQRVKVESGGDDIVAHVGLHALGCFADRLGLGDSLSSRIPPVGERMPVHDRGKVFVHTALMLASGGESCADIEHLRLQPVLFGSVASDSTVHRTFHEITSATRAEIALAVAEVRTKIWDRSSVTSGRDPVVLDIDASLVEIHTDGKEQAAPTYSC
jgi:Transposase DDE domain group 1